jgi:hypothetical protein
VTDRFETPGSPFGAPSPPPVASDLWAPPGSVFAAPVETARLPRWLPAAAVAVALVLVITIGGYLVLSAFDSHDSADPGLTPLPAPVAPERAVVPTWQPGPPAGDGVVVSRQMAEDAVGRWWHAHSLALRDADVPALTGLTGGAGRQWEVGAVSCGCLESSTLRPMIRTNYYVPRQTTYPARFVAEVLTAYSNGNKGVEVLVFSRSNRTAPWQVIENSGYGPETGHRAALHPQDQDLVDSHGLVDPVGRAQVARTRAAATRLSAVWQQAKVTGQVPASASAFTLGEQTMDRIVHVAGHRQDRVQDNGLLGHFHYYARRSDPVVVVPYGPGHDLGCMPLRSTITYWGRPGQVVHQDPALRNWGTGVPAGDYRSITLHEAWPTCFVISRSGVEPVFVLNKDYGGGPATPAPLDPGQPQASTGLADSPSVAIRTMVAPGLRLAARV